MRAGSGPCRARWPRTASRWTACAARTAIISRSSRPYDDVALLMARTRRLGAEQVATWDLSTDPAMVAEARKVATQQLSTWGLDELAFTTELVVERARHQRDPVRLGADPVASDHRAGADPRGSDGAATAPASAASEDHLRGWPRAVPDPQFTRRWAPATPPRGRSILGRAVADHPAHDVTDGHVAGGFSSRGTRVTG